MELTKCLELQLTEVELGALIKAVSDIPHCGIAYELERKLRTAWRRGHRPDDGSVTPDVG